VTSGSGAAPLTEEQRVAAIADLLRRADAAAQIEATVALGEHVIAAARVPKRHQESLTRLTPMEVAAMRFLGWGRSNADIATLLLISENTVRVHLNNICRKLELDGMRELGTLAGLLFYPVD
jgi:DNA-binding NarL/FixJ family response regulator